MSSDLCEELIFEIFTRLPSKSLLRFGSLSKSFCSFIASPGFIRMHTSRSPQKVMFTHQDHKGHSVKYTLHSEDQLPLCPERGYIGITAVEFPYSASTYYWASTWSCVGSCNGILCLFDQEKYSITLWNPSIRRELTLPNSPSTSRCPGCDCEYNRVGFGFDSVSDDYKIVSLPKKGGTRKRSYVYTMKTGAWCKIASPTPWYRKVETRGCCVNGAIHWLVYIKSDKVHYSIMTFNLSTYVFGIIASPKPSWLNRQITTIEGSLAVMISSKKYFRIWVMREYNNTASWSVFFKSKVNLIGVLQPTRNGNLLLKCGASWEGFQVYDAKIAKRSQLQNLHADSYILHMEPYVESLQPLDIGTLLGN